MTVSELITALQKHDPEMRVVVKGYEAGFEDVHGLEVQRIAIDADKDSSVYGDHARAGYLKESELDKLEIENAVYIRPMNEWNDH